LNAKQNTTTLIVIIAAASIWFGLRQHLYDQFAPLALSIDIFLAWCATPYFLHGLSIVILTIGLSSTKRTQQILFNIGILFESIATTIDKVNSIIPHNPFCAGASGRKVMLGAFLHSLEKREATKKYVTKLVKEFKANGASVPLSDLTGSLTFLAEIAHSEGNYQEARNISEETLALIDGTSIDPLRKAATLIDMCSTQVKQGLIEESIATGIKAVDCLDSSNSGHNQLQAIAYNNLSLAYSYAGDYEEALRSARRSFNLKQSASGGKATSSMAIAHSNISDYLIYLSRFDDALSEARKALTMLDNLGFKDGLIRATVLQNLGSAYLGLGNVVEAKKYLLESLAGKTKHMNMKDPEWSSVYVDLGMLYGALNEISTADGYFSKSVSVARKGLGDKHPRLAFIYSKYATFLTVIGRDADAAPLRKEASDIKEHWAALKKLRTEQL